MGGPGYAETAQVSARDERPMRSPRGRLRKAVVGVAVLALVAGSTAVPGVVGAKPDATIYATNFNLSPQCNLGTTVDLPAWACYDPALGAYFGWWLTPNYTPLPGAPHYTAPDPVNVDKIAADGSFDKTIPAPMTDPVQPEGAMPAGLKSTLWFILAQGSRAQPAFSKPSEWIADNAKLWVEKVKNTAAGSSAKTAIEFVKATLGASCPTSVRHAAFAGYVLWTVGESPDTAVPGCNLRTKVTGAYDAATGRYGTGLADTIWAVIAQRSWDGASSPADAAKTADYVKGQALAADAAGVPAYKTLPGGWGDAATKDVDFPLTSLAIQALLILATAPGDTAIAQATDKLGAAQNADAGFGFAADKTTPKTNTIESAFVYSGFKALADDAGAPEHWGKLTKAVTSDAPEVCPQATGQTGRLGLEIRAGICQQEQRYVADEGRFRTYSVVSSETAEERSWTLPTSIGVYHAIFWHQARLGNNGGGTSAAETGVQGATAAEAVTANPSVTG